MKIIILLSLLLLCGCVSTSKVIEALGKDTNSVRVVVTTIYGSITVERNLPYKVILTP